MKKKKEKRSLSDVESREHLPIKKGKRKGLNHNWFRKGEKKGEKKKREKWYIPETENLSRITTP